MTTTILLIRHGQTDWNAAGRWQGHEDIPLNGTGRKQAALLAARLAQWRITAVYSSDLKRAAETAAILAEALRLEVIADRAWRERNGGAFQGLTGAEIEVQLPEAWANLRRGIVAPPGGETGEDLRRRITGAFHRLVQQHNGEMVAVVTHGGALRALITHVLLLPPDNDPRISLRGNTGLSIVEVEEGLPPRLVRLNDTGHLEDPWRA